MSRVREAGQNGLNVNEQRIMDLWDAGLSRQRIIMTTGLAPSYVKATLTNFTHDAADDRAFADATRSASRALAAACIATGSYFQ